MLAFTHTMHDYNHTLMVNQRNVNKTKKKLQKYLSCKAVVKCSPGSEVNP